MKSLFCALLLISLPYMVSYLGASQPCQFSIAVHSMSIYETTSNLSMNYTLNTPPSCTIQLSGTFLLSYKANGTAIFSAPLSVSYAGNATASYALPKIRMGGLELGAYAAEVSLSSPNYTASGTSSFLLLNPTNITLKGFSVGSTFLGAGAQLDFIADIENSGDLASTSTNIVISIRGPKNYSIIEPVEGLSPGSKESILLIPGNITSLPGYYTATAYVSYTSASSSVKSSNKESAAYSVAPSQYPLAPQPQIQASSAQISKYLSVSMPSFVSGFAGSVPVSDIYLSNKLSLPENISIGLPGRFGSLISLSSNSAFLLPGQSLLLQAFFNASLSLPGLYQIPINISVRTPSGNAMDTEYIAYGIKNATDNAELLSQLYTSGGRTSVSYTLYSPHNKSIENATFTVLLPAGAAAWASRISALGSPSSVNASNGSVYIKWYIAHIPAGGNMQISYHVSNASDVYALPYADSLLIEPSAHNSGSVLKVVGMSVPTIYSGTSGRISANILYTGSSEQNVTLELLTIGDLSIHNYVQTIKASPNQLLSPVFNITAANETGTYMLTLSAEAGSSALNYTLPLFVLRKPSAVSTAPAATTTTVQLGAYIPQYAISETLILEIVAVFIAAILILVAAQRYAQKGIASSNAKELKAFREMVKRV